MFGCRRLCTHLPAGGSVWLPPAWHSLTGLGESGWLTPAVSPAVRLSGGGGGGQLRGRAGARLLPQGPRGVHGGVHGDALGPQGEAPEEGGSEGEAPAQKPSVPPVRLPPPPARLLTVCLPATSLPSPPAAPPLPLPAAARCRRVAFAPSPPSRSHSPGPRCHTHIAPALTAAPGEQPQELRRVLRPRGGVGVRAGAGGVPGTRGRKAAPNPRLGRRVLVHAHQEPPHH